MFRTVQKGVENKMANITMAMYKLMVRPRMLNRFALYPLEFHSRTPHSYMKPQIWANTFPYLPELRVGLISLAPKGPLSLHDGPSEVFGAHHGET